MVRNFACPRSKPLQEECHAPRSQKTAGPWQTFSIQLPCVDLRVEIFVLLAEKRFSQEPLKMDIYYGKADRFATARPLSCLIPRRHHLATRSRWGDEENLGGVALSGPHHCSYGVLDETGRDVSESETTVVLRQNMVPWRDSRIGFTFAPGAGPHWSMTVMVSPEGKVNEVKPFHTCNSNAPPWCGSRVTAAQEASPRKGDKASLPTVTLTFTRGRVAL